MFRHLEILPWLSRSCENIDTGPQTIWNIRNSPSIICLYKVQRLEQFPSAIVESGFDVWRKTDGNTATVMSKWSLKHFDVILIIWTVDDGWSGKCSWYCTGLASWRHLCKSYWNPVCLRDGKNLQRLNCTHYVSECQTYHQIREADDHEPPHLKFTKL